MILSLLLKNAEWQTGAFLIAAKISPNFRIYEILQDFSMTEDETRKELIDTYDDGDTWTDGALNRPAFKDINVCYVLHALCCHFHYALADVLRMNGFSLAVQVAYEHIYK